MCSRRWTRGPASFHFERWTRVVACGRASFHSRGQANVFRRESTNISISIRNANANVFMVLWFLFILGFFFILVGGGLRVGGDRVGEVRYG